MEGGRAPSAPENVGGYGGAGANGGEGGAWWIWTGASAPFTPTTTISNGIAPGGGGSGNYNVASGYNEIGTNHGGPGRVVITYSS